MKLTQFVVVVLCAVLMIQPVLAAPPASYTTNFTPIFNKTHDNVVYNETYRWNDEPYTPYQNLYLYVICAIVLSVLGYRFKCEYCSALAIMFSIMGAFSAQAVDFAYYGVTSTVNEAASPNVYNYVGMSVHEITPMPNMMIAMGVICVLSMINMYIIYIWHKSQDITQ